MMNFDYLVIGIMCFGLFTSIYFLLILIENKNKFHNPITKNYQSVTLIVPAWNEEKTIIESIKSLIELDYPKNKLKIFVVDDGSKDNTYGVVKKFLDENPKLKKVLYVFKKKNGGKGSAVNFGIKRATSELVGVMDADSIVEKSALKKMIGFFDDPVVYSVTPSMRTYKPKNLLERIQDIEYLLGIYLRKTFSFVDAIHVTPGPFSIFRKKFFDEYGGFDEKDNLTEDIEIALRIQSHHFKIKNAVNAVVYAHNPTKFKPLLVQRRRWYYGFLKNIEKYRFMFSPSYGDLGLFFLPIAFLSILFSFVIIIKTLYSFLTGIWEWFFNALAVNFDLTKLVDLKLDLFFLNQDPLFLISPFILVISLFIIYLGSRWGGGEKHKFPILSYVYFTLFYLFLYCFWWLIAILYKLFNRKVVWR